MKDEPACGTCKFWKNYDYQNGTCLRYPPQMSGVGRSDWPTSGRGNWCGEHKPAKPKPQ